MAVRKSKSSIEDFVVDFSKEESTGGGIRVKPGFYHVRITNAVAKESAQKGTPGVELTLTFLDGKYRGKKLYEWLWASPKTRKRIRDLYEALGIPHPTKLTLGKIAREVKGEELYVQIDDDTPREGFDPRSRVTKEGFFSVEDMDQDEEEEELEDEEELEEEGEEEELEDEEEEEEPEPPKRKAKQRPAAEKKPVPRKRRRRPMLDEDEDEDELDLDEL